MNEDAPQQPSNEPNDHERLHEDKDAGSWAKVPRPDPVAWADLFSSLLGIAQRSKLPTEDASGASGFSAADAALQAVIKYLIACPELMDAHAVAPLHVLSRAMADLRKGRKPPLLQPHPKPNRPDRDEGTAMVVGFAARCMSELMEAGEKADEAAKMVAKALSRGWQKTTAIQVTNWRYRCMQGNPDTATQHFNAPLPPSWALATPRARAKELLAVLTSMKDRGLF